MISTIDKNHISYIIGVSLDNNDLRINNKPDPSQIYKDVTSPIIIEATVKTYNPTINLINHPIDEDDLNSDNKIIDSIINNGRRQYVSKSQKLDQLPNIIFSFHDSSAHPIIIGEPVSFHNEIDKINNTDYTNDNGENRILKDN